MNQLFNINTNLTDNEGNKLYVLKQRTQKYIKIEVYIAKREKFTFTPTSLKKFKYMYHILEDLFFICLPTAGTLQINIIIRIDVLISLT